MSTQAVTPEPIPEVTINNSAAEIKAAMEAPVTPVVETPAPAPVVPQPTQAEWGQLAKNPDGSYQVTLATGEVFKGSADEVIAKQAEAHVHTKRWAQEIKTKAETPAAPVVETPQESPDDIATRNWLVEQTAKAFGMTPDEYRAAVQQVFNTTQQTVQITRQQELNNAWLDFTQACPDFVDTPETCSALVEYLPADVVAQKRVPSSDDLKRAHAAALYDKKYQPGQVTAQQPHVPVPPVMPSSGASTTVGEVDPYKIPIAELKKLIGQ